VLTCTVYMGANSRGGQENLIVLHQSIFMLIVRIIVLELVVDFVYILLKLPDFYFDLSSRFKVELIPYYLTIFIVLSILKVIILLYVVLRWATTYYEIGKTEIKFRRGIFGIHLKTYSCAHMQEVNYAQSLIGRVFNYGTVEIYSPSIEDKILLQDIPDPKKYQQLIETELINTKSVGYKP